MLQVIAGNFGGNGIVDTREQGAGAAVGHAGPVAGHVLVGVAGSPHLRVDGLLRPILHVDDGVDAAHEPQGSLELLPQPDNVVGRDDALPDVDADALKLPGNGLEEGIGVVDDDYVVFL